jgi:hypothetical protein
VDTASSINTFLYVVGAVIVGTALTVAAAALIGAVGQALGLRTPTRHPFARAETRTDPPRHVGAGRGRRASRASDAPDGRGMAPERSMPMLPRSPGRR